ncbi:MAG TPA: SlyX family protein [Planctomycetes bacterium]|nr:SlyX family protein [Planctomycetota bacterium]
MPAESPRPDRIDLESKIAFLEHTVDALNEVVVSQAATLDRMSARLALLEQRLSQDRGEGIGDGAASGDLEAHRPPHY